MTLVSDPFHKPIAYLIKADGGIDTRALYADSPGGGKGIRIFLLTMQGTDNPRDNPDNENTVIMDGKKYPTWSFAVWDAVRRDGTRPITEQIDKLHDAIWIPWAFIKTDAESERLRPLIQEAFDRQPGKMARPTGVPNVEKYLDPQYVDPKTGIRGETVHVDRLVHSMAGFEIMLSTTPWAFEGLDQDATYPDGTPRPGYDDMPADWIIDDQIFPAENGSSKDPRSCRARFYDFGFKGDVHFQLGYHGCTPSQLPYSGVGRSSIYPADGSNLDLWKPRSLEPLTKKQFAYLGPGYGPSDPKGRQSKPSENWRILKRVLNSAGYANFPHPDTAFNKPLEEALKRAQRDHGVKDTGAYGLGTDEVFRVLPSSVPGITYAVEL